MFLRFVFGLIIGSFVNVVAVRYKGDRFLFHPGVIGGRSECPRCKKKLGPLELIPLLSFIFQRGKCRGCKAKISWQYPMVEILSGLIFAFVPWRAGEFPLALQNPIPFYVIWILVLEILLLLSLIDLRLQIIPDELNIALGITGLSAAWLKIQSNFMGPYSLLFGFQNDDFLNRFIGAAFLFLFFGLVIMVTRGKGMGMGDLKLAAALGLVFGWPGGLILTGLSFVLGGIVGGIAILFFKKTRKTLLPFGPFLALGAVTLFFWGESLFGLYIKILSTVGVRFFG